jgi:hypothetical protein
MCTHLCKVCCVFLYVHTFVCFARACFTVDFRDLPKHYVSNCDVGDDGSSGPWSY